MTMGDTIDVQDLPAYLQSHTGEEHDESAPSKPRIPPWAR